MSDRSAPLRIVIVGGRGSLRPRRRRGGRTPAYFTRTGSSPHIPEYNPKHIVDGRRAAGGGARPRGGGVCPGTESRIGPREGCRPRERGALHRNRGGGDELIRRVREQVQDGADGAQKRRAPGDPSHRWPVAALGLLAA